MTSKIPVLFSRAYTPSFKSYLLSMYEFESSGNDSTPNGYNLTPVNTPTYVAGKVGNAANLVRASNQYFTYTDAGNVFGGMTKLSVSFWVKMASNVNSETHLGEYVSSSNLSFRVWSSATFMRFEVFPQNAGTYTTWSFGSPPTIGSWTHIVCTYDGTAITNHLTAYVNNSKSQNSLGSGSGALRAISSTFVIGNLSAASQALDGIIDQVSIWSGYCLTDADVTWLYNNGNGRAYSEYT